MIVTCVELKRYMWRTRVRIDRTQGRVVEMKQVSLNLFISTIILGLVFIVADRGTPTATTSVSFAPTIMIDSLTDGQMHLHGSGFRPASLVSVRLEHRGGIAAPVASANTWVDAHGAFAADLNIERLSRDNTPAWDDFVVLASGSTASVSIPVVPPTARAY